MPKNFIVLEVEIILFYFLRHSFDILAGPKLAKIWRLRKLPVILFLDVNSKKENSLARVKFVLQLKLYLRVHVHIQINI